MSLQDPQGARRQQRAADAVQAAPRSAQRARNAPAGGQRRGSESLGESTVEAHPEVRLQGQLVADDQQQQHRSGRGRQQGFAEVSFWLWSMDLLGFSSGWLLL